MYRLLLSAFVLCAFSSVSAQDVIITKDGDSKKVYGLEVGTTAVFFRESEDPESPIRRVNKDALLLIKYQDGRKDIMGDNTLKDHFHDASNTPSEGSVEDGMANAEIVNSIRNNEVRFAGQPSKDKANMLLCLYMPKTGSVFADKNMELFFRSEPSGTFGGDKNRPTAYDIKLYISVKNKTSKILYLDLGNTFFISGSVAYPFYVPSATSDTHGTTTGIGVNLGGIAGAVGLGGTLGKIAGGMTVGSSSSHSSATTVFAQRVVAVPPLTEKTLDEVRLFPKGAPIFNDNFKYGGTYKELSLYFSKDQMINIGEERTYDENNDLAPFGAMITYSNDEDQTTPHVLNASFYVQKVIGTKAAHNLDQKYFDTQSVSPNFRNILHFFARQRKK